MAQSSDLSTYKSVIAFGRAEIIDDENRMKPYLQKLIDKYRVPVEFERYMRGRNREGELRSVRICVITPTKITGKKFESRRLEKRLKAPRIVFMRHEMNH